MVSCKHREDATVRTQIQLEDSQAAALRELAVRQKVSVAEMVRRSVNRLLAEERPATVEERRRRALAAVGSIRSGAGDLSARHDEVAAEAYRR